MTSLEPLAATLRVERLSDPALWGREISDERYAIVADVR